MGVPGNITVMAGASGMGVIPIAVNTVDDPVLFANPLYKYANLDLPFSPNDPGLQFTLPGIDPLLSSTLAARFFNLMDEYSEALFLGQVKPINPPIIFEPPLRMCLSGVPEMWLVVSDSDPNYAGNFPQFSSDGGLTWLSPKDITGSIIMFDNATTGYVTFEDFPEHVDVDADDTLVVDLTESFGILTSYIVEDRDTFRYPSYLSNSLAVSAIQVIENLVGNPCPGQETTAFAVGPNGGGGNGGFAAFCGGGGGAGVGSAGGMNLSRGPITSSLDPVKTATAFQTLGVPGGIDPADICAAFVVYSGSKTDFPFNNTHGGVFCTGTSGAIGTNTVLNGLWGHTFGPVLLPGPVGFADPLTIFQAALDTPDGNGVTARQAIAGGSVMATATLGSSLIGGIVSNYECSTMLIVYVTGGGIFLPSSGGGPAGAGVSGTGTLGSGGAGLTPINYELIAHTTASGGILTASGGIAATGGFLWSIPGPTGLGGPIRRAVFSMPVPGVGSDHPISTRYAWLNDRLNRKPPGIMKIPLDQAWLGKALLFRFAAFGINGGVEIAATLQRYGYIPSGLAFSQFSSSPSYVQAPSVALSQIGTGVSGILMAEVTESFATNTMKYNARKFDLVGVPDPVVGQTYYVTIYDPLFVGDFGTETNLPAFCEITQDRVGAPGFVYIGSIVAQSANFGTDIVTPGGWPPPVISLVNGV